MVLPVDYGNSEFKKMEIKTKMLTIRKDKVKDVSNKLHGL